MEKFELYAEARVVWYLERRKWKQEQFAGAVRRSSKYF